MNQFGKKFVFLLVGAFVSNISIIQAQSTAAAPTPTAVAPAPAPAAAVQIVEIPKLKLKPYGYIKLDAIYDTHRVAAGDVMYYVQPKPSSGSDDEFRMTARETRIGLNLSAEEIHEITATGKIEVDFYGSGGSDNAANLRMRLAYIDLAMPSGFSVRAGQDWETFVTILPRIVNFSFLADAGALGLRRPQVRATQEVKLTDKTKLIAKLAAARTIGQDIDGGGYDDGVDSGLPTMQGNLILESPLWTEKAAKISVSGHIGRETCDKVEDGVVVANDDKNYDTWSVIGSLYLPLIKMATLQGTIWQGENLDTYYGGIGQGINKTLEKSIAAHGGFAQILFDLTEKLNLNIGYGLDNPDGGDLNAKDRSKNEIIFSSVFYKLTPAATLAFEYSNIRTSYKASAKAENNRFQGALKYEF